MLWSRKEIKMTKAKIEFYNDVMYNSGQDINI